MKLADILNEYSMSRYMNRYHFFSDMGAFGNMWNNKNIEYSPNEHNSFEMRMLKSLLNNKKGMEPKKDWGYKEKNKIKNLIQTSYIEFNGKTYHLTKEGEKYIRHMMNVPHKGIHVPVWANVYSMYKTKG